MWEMWDELLTAIALILVIEGIFPFLSPSNMRKMLIRIAQQNDKTLRVIGLVSMICGALIMYVIHSGILL